MEKLHDVVEINDLKDMLKKTGELYPNNIAYKLKTETIGEFKLITHKEFREDIDYLGTSLINLGLKNKKIAVIGDNSYEWSTSYLAVSCGTGVIVPLDKSLPKNEIENLLIRSDAEAIIFSAKYNEIMLNIKENNKTHVKFFISIKNEETNKNIILYKELIEKGKELLKNGEKSFLDAKINNEEMAFMLFTSGTTDTSKAVMLSHKNLASNLMQIDSVLKIYETDVFLSFLPIHHTFECTTGFLTPIYAGSCITFSDGVKHLADNMKEFNINVMVSVPALFEGVYKKLLKGIEKKGKLDTIKKVVKISNFLLKIGIDIRKYIFKDIHEALGGKIRLFVNGGAALDKDVEQGLVDFGFKIFQGYGLTETSPVCVAGNDKYTKIGTIGKALPDVETKIDNPNENGIGEFLVKGPMVMLGYYQNIEATNEAIKDGWLYTGDLAKIDSEGFITITGRKKSVIVLKNGKNIFPEELEQLINRIDGIKECIIYPKQDKDDNVKICLKAVYSKESFEERYPNLLITEDYILEIIWKEVKEINKTLAVYKYIKEVIVTEEELIKTTTQKIKRFEEINKILGEQNEK